jgi:aminoglycoside phosphotransferase (APT) family kinase protein
MTRLPGSRWADRRQDLTESQSTRLHRRIGRLLRRFHQASQHHTARRAFGGLLSTDPTWPSLSAAVMHRCVQLTRRYRDTGGAAELIGAIERFVTSRGDILDSCQQAVLCHNDFIDGNLLVADAGDPVVTGIVDFERASFFDPLADLALTLRNATYHQPTGAQELLAAYGIDRDGRRRMAIHHLLHALAERIWISTDRPAGWRDSVNRLDGQLRRAVRGS